MRYDEYIKNTAQAEMSEIDIPSFQRAINAKSNSIIEEQKNCEFNMVLALGSIVYIILIICSFYQSVFAKDHSLLKITLSISAVTGFLLLSLFVMLEQLKVKERREH